MIEKQRDNLSGDAVVRLAEQYRDVRGGLLPLLHAVQEEVGYVSDESIRQIAQTLNLSRAEVHGVVSFYPDFRRQRPAVHVVKLCSAESCQARGADAVQTLAVAHLGVEMGAVSVDGKVALEPVYCLGLCAIGPNCLVDGRPVARLDQAKIAAIAAEVRL